MLMAGRRYAAADTRGAARKKTPNLNSNTSQQHNGRCWYFCHFSNSHNCHPNAWVTNYTEHTSRQSCSHGQKFTRSQPIDHIMSQLNPLQNVTAYSFYTRVVTLIVATIYLQLIQNRYMFRSFTVLQCSHQHCVQPVASDVEVVGYL